MDQDGTSYLVQSIVSKTKTLNGQNIWNLNPDSQLHGNLNTSQLHISSYFKGYTFDQLGTRFESWITEPSEFQFSTGGNEFNIFALYWLANTRANNGSTAYDPNNVIFGIEYKGSNNSPAYILFHEIAATGQVNTGSAVARLEGTALCRKTGTLY